MGYPHIYFILILHFFRETNCPQCRQDNPSTHKLYLILNDAIEETDEVVYLRSQLETYENKIEELNAQLEQSDLNFLSMQEQYTSEGVRRKQLEKQIGEMTNNDEDFLRLHALYSESEKLVEELRKENERLVIENSNKCEDIRTRSDEISNLLETMCTMHIENSNENETKNSHLSEQLSALRHRITHLEKENCRLERELLFQTYEIELKAKEIGVLKEFANKKNDCTARTEEYKMDLKLKHVFGQLEEEIEKNAKLSVDNIKLRTQIQKQKLDI